MNPLDLTGVVAIIPLFYENTGDGGYEPADDETILAQPCVRRRLAELEARLVVAECSPLGAKVYNHLRDHGAQTTGQLCAALGMSRMHVGNVTKPLILSGRVARVAHGVYRAVGRGEVWNG